MTRAKKAGFASAWFMRGLLAELEGADRVMPERIEQADGVIDLLTELIDLLSP